MFRFFFHQATLRLLVVAAGIVGSATLLCATAAEASSRSRAALPESCCCLFNPAEQPPYVLFPYQEGRLRGPELPACLTGLCTSLASAAPATQEAPWPWTSGSRPMHGQYRLGLAQRAPPAVLHISFLLSV